MQKMVYSKIGLAVLMAGLSCAAMVANAADVKVYGKAFLTVQNSEEGTTVDKTELLSNASRVGFKGDNDLSETLKVIYQVEYETTMDGTDATVLRQRNTFAGLKGDLGTLIGGKHDTPLKLTQNKIDLFNDLSGDFKAVFQGENRSNNIVMYSTPTFGAFQVNVANILSEKNPTPIPAVAEDGTSISAIYTTDALYLALGLDRSVGSSTSQLKTATRDITRLVGQFNVGSFIIGLMGQSAEKSNPNPATIGDDKSESGVFGSVAYKAGDLTLKVQTGSSDELALGNEQTSFGVDYKLAAKTRVFGFVTSQSVNAANSDKDYIGFGLEHDF